MSGPMFHCSLPAPVVVWVFRCSRRCDWWACVLYPSGFFPALCFCPLSVLPFVYCLVCTWPDLSAGEDSHSCFSLPPCLGRWESLYNQHGIMHAIQYCAPTERVYSFICSVFPRMIYCVLVLTLKIWKYYCRVRQYISFGEKTEFQYSICIHWERSKLHISDIQTPHEHRQCAHSRFPQSCWSFGLRDTDHIYLAAITE